MASTRSNGLEAKHVAAEVLAGEANGRGCPKVSITRGAYERSW